MSEMKSEKKGGIKTKIICKYFIQGKCIKGDSCPYLHSKVEKPKEIIQIECPMYNIGFCKNGRNCHFLHVKKDKYIEEKVDDANKGLNMPIEEEEKNGNNLGNKDKEKNNNQLENKDEIKYPEIPIWYLEHYFDKPISLIFSELEQKNVPEVTELKKKYGFTNIQPNLPIFPFLNKKNKMNLNMNTLNLNFNNFNMNFGFDSNKTDINNKTNKNVIQNSFQLNNIKIGQNSSDKNYDKYGLKKNNNEYLLNKQENIFYYLIRCKNSKEIEKSQESNIITLPSSLYDKYKDMDIQNKTIIIIICEEEFQNFSGFAKLKTPLITEKKEETLFNIQWLWRTKLSLSKVNHLMNKADNDNLLINGKNGCEVDKDLGLFCCRYMMKRLSKEEMKELTNEKKMFESEKKLLLQNLNNDRYNQTKSNSNSNNNLNKINNSSKDLNYINKKYENNEMKTPHKSLNKKSSEICFTNSSKYSDYNKHEKDKDYLVYKDHKDHKYTGNKRNRDYSRSKSRSNNRRDNSEDYSNYYKSNNKKYKYVDKYHQYNYNNHNGNSYYSNSNNKYYINQRNYNNHKEDNLYQTNKYNDNQNYYSNKKYYK